MHLYVCPKIDENSGEQITVQNITIEKHLRHLYQYLIDNDYIRSIDTIKNEHLLIKSEEVIEKFAIMIRPGRP